MKISRNRLQQIIKEELNRALNEKELTKDDFKLLEPMKKWLREKLVSLGSDEKVAQTASKLFWSGWREHEDENLKRVKAKLEEKITAGNWKIIAAYSDPQAISKRLSKAVPYDANKGTK